MLFIVSLAGFIYYYRKNNTKKLNDFIYQKKETLNY